jgi:hypothetical protein
MPQSALQIVKDFFPQVMGVKDAKKHLVIKVTEKDIKQAQQKDHIDCAMAVACKKGQGADGVIMAIKTAYIIKDDQAVRYKLPERTAREIVAFDKGGRFSPGEYELKAPSKFQKLGASTRPSGKKPYKKKRGKDL